MRQMRFAGLVLFLVSLGQINGDSKSIQGDFIFKLALNDDFTREEAAAIFINSVRDLTESRAEELDTYIIGDFVAVRCKITAEDVQRMKNIDGVIEVENTVQNVVVHAYDVKGKQKQEETCEVQRLTADTWGLARILSRKMPDYSDGTFCYLNEDGKDVDVYVVDTGIEPFHEEYLDHVRQAFVAKSHLEEGPKDFNGHGTHVASIIAGKTFGIAKQANLINVKVLNRDGEGSLADMLQGMQFIYEDFSSKRFGRDLTAKGVINLSLGIPNIADMPEASELLRDAIVQFTRDGRMSIPVIAAAGNGYGMVSNAAPAGIPEVITVGASSDNDKIAPYSNTGTGIDIFAPGSEITGATFEETFEEYLASIGESREVEEEEPTIITATMKTTGTSNAAAFVSGVVARVLSQLEEAKTHEEVRQLMVETATRDVLSMDGAEPGTPNRLLYMAPTIEETLGRKETTPVRQESRMKTSVRQKSRTRTIGRQIDTGNFQHWNFWRQVYQRMRDASP